MKPLLVVLESVVLWIDQTHLKAWITFPSTDEGLMSLVENLTGLWPPFVNVCVFEAEKIDICQHEGLSHSDREGLLRNRISEFSYCHFIHQSEMSSVVSIKPNKTLQKLQGLFSNANLSISKISSFGVVMQSHPALKRVTHKHNEQIIIAQLGPAVFIRCYYQGYLIFSRNCFLQSQAKIRKAHRQELIQETAAYLRAQGFFRAENHYQQHVLSIGYRFFKALQSYSPLSMNRACDLRERKKASYFKRRLRILSPGLCFIVLVVMVSRLIWLGGDYLWSLSLPDQFDQHESVSLKTNALLHQRLEYENDQRSQIKEFDDLSKKQKKTIKQIYSSIFLWPIQQPSIEILQVDWMQESDHMIWTLKGQWTPRINSLVFLEEEFESLITQFAKPLGQYRISVFPVQPDVITMIEQNNVIQDALAFEVEVKK